MQTSYTRPNVNDSTRPTRLDLCVREDDIWFELTTPDVNIRANVVEEKFGQAARVQDIEQELKMSSGRLTTAAIADMHFARELFLALSLSFNSMQQTSLTTAAAVGVIIAAVDMTVLSRGFLPIK